MTAATMTNSITLGLTANYCKNWTVVQAIREILANALDTHTKPAITWEAGVATVTDFGSGFSPNGLLIGETTKTTNDIGQYGEGLKVGAMVLLRNNCWIKAESLGKRYTFTMEDSIVGTQVLTIYMDECQTPKKGTIVRFACSQAELNEAKSLFLAITPRDRYDKNILHHAGSIYVQGLLTEQLKSILSYNITAKDAMNRDRTVLNRDVVSREVRNILRQTKSYEAITDIIRACEDEGMRDSLEADCYFTPEHKRLWKKAFSDLHGNKACLTEQQSSRAKYLGYKCITLPWSIRHTLNIAGVKLDHEVVHKDASRSARVNVTASQRAILAKARAILQPVFAPDLTTKYTVRICKMQSDGERDGKVIRINIAILDDLGKTMAVLFHELCHMVYSHADCSAEFEADLTHYGGKLAMALLTNVKTTPKRVKKGVSSLPCPSIPIEDNEVAEGSENPEKDGVVTPDPTPIRQLIKETEREIARLEREIASQTVNASRETEPTVMKGSFGLPMENVTTYWGARAIYQPSSKTNFMPIEILHDRQSCLGEKPDRDELVAWLNTTGMPWLKANCRMPSNSSERIEFKDGKFIIRATPNASYGYLYIGAGIVSN